MFWNPTADVKCNRLKRFTVPVDTQKEHESERLACSLVTVQQTCYSEYNLDSFSLTCHPKTEKKKPLKTLQV